MTTYDVILVLGGGIKDDGSLFESVQANVQKAVELYKQGIAPKVVFSGKWSYKTNDNPPKFTEAETMSKYAKSLGLLEESIVLEEKSDTTVANAYFLKKMFLNQITGRRFFMLGQKLSLKEHYLHLKRCLVQNIFVIMYYQIINFLRILRAQDWNQREIN